MWSKGTSVRELAADTVPHFHVIASLIENKHTHSLNSNTPPSVAPPHLASGLGSFPDAEVADEPGQGQTQGQLPAHPTHVLNTIWDLQHSASDWTQTPCCQFESVAVVSNSQLVRQRNSSMLCNGVILVIFSKKQTNIASSLQSASGTISRNVKFLCW